MNRIAVTGYFRSYIYHASVRACMWSRIFSLETVYMHLNTPPNDVFGNEKYIATIRHAKQSFLGIYFFLKKRKDFRHGNLITRQRNSHPTETTVINALIFTPNRLFIISQWLHGCLLGKDEQNSSETDKKRTLQLLSLL